MNHILKIYIMLHFFIVLSGVRMPRQTINFPLILANRRCAWEIEKSR